jgi:hypothetical protein
MSRSVVLLLLTVLVLSSFVMFGSVFAQSTPKPSVPEFTVKYVDNSYYVPPTTTTDPYTGETVTQGGFYGKGEPEIEITIKNQPFTSYIDTATNNGISLFYQVRTKGHFSPDWSTVEYWRNSPRNPYQEQDYASQYTVLKYGSLVSQNIPSKGELDIQVQALIGYVTIHGDPNHALDFTNLFASFEFAGETSDWSNTQTLTIGEVQTPTPSPETTPIPSSSPAPTPTPSPEPKQAESFQTILVVASTLSMAVVGVGLLVYFKKRKH